jgi:hypothetical protein
MKNKTAVKPASTATPVDKSVKKTVFAFKKRSPIPTKGLQKATWLSAINESVGDGSELNVVVVTVQLDEQDGITGVPREIMMDDMAAEPLEIHTFAHDLAAYQYIREKWGVERSHQAAPFFTFRFTRGFLHVGQSNGYPFVVLVTIFTFDPNATGLGPRCGFKVKAAFFGGTLFGDKLNKGLEFLLPRNTGFITES